MTECASQHECHEFKPSDGNSEEPIYQLMEAGDIFVISRTNNSFLVIINTGGDVTIKNIEIES